MADLDRQNGPEKLNGRPATQNHDIVVIGTSAGGVEALISMVGGLQPDLPAAIFIVLHMSPTSPSLLSTILGRRSSLPVVQAEDGAEIKMGTIYVACPDHHLVLERGFMRVTRGPKENRHRPAVDPLFRSAAITYGPRVIGVILTGALDDGTSGLQAIKERGGTTVVQEPSEALYPSMPASAIRNVKVDHITTMSDLPSLLATLCSEPAGEEPGHPAPASVVLETEIATMDNTDEDVLNKLGKPSVYACPECHGTLWEMEDGTMLRFRCRVGHAYSEESMLEEHGESLESALWAALRALEESAALCRRMGARAEENEHTHLAARYRAEVHEKETHIVALRRVLDESGKPALSS